MTKSADHRRLKLKLWTETHSIPPAEKSYFSQLLGGTASFGEKAAARLEEKYGMGAGYLDAPLPSDERVDKTSNRGQNRPLSKEAESLIRCVRRLDALGVPARNLFVVQRQMMAVAYSFGQMQYPLTADEYLTRALEDLESRPDMNEETQHGTTEERAG